MNDILDDGIENLKNKNTLDEETLRTINRMKPDISEDIKHVKNARIALIVMIVLGLGASVLIHSLNGWSIEVIIELFILFAIYIACAIGVAYNPVIALTIGLSVYLLYWMLMCIIDISFLYQGLLIRVIVLFFLIKGIISAFKLRKHIEKLFRLGAPMTLIDQVKELDELYNIRRR